LHEIKILQTAGSSHGASHSVDGRRDESGDDDDSYHESSEDDDDDDDDDDEDDVYFKGNVDAYSDYMKGDVDGRQIMEENVDDEEAIEGDP